MTPTERAAYEAGARDMRERAAKAADAEHGAECDITVLGADYGKPCQCQTKDIIAAIKALPLTPDAEAEKQP